MEIHSYKGARILKAAANFMLCFFNRYRLNNENKLFALLVFELVRLAGPCSRVRSFSS
jgi:hypothetical protein